MKTGGTCRYRKSSCFTDTLASLLWDYLKGLCQRMDTNLSSATKPSYVDSFKRLYGGVHFQFPKFKHDHPPVMNVNEIVDEHYTLGQKIADKVASGMGSWRFIIIQTTILALWAILNTVAWWAW